MTSKTPSVTKKQHEATEPESHQMVKCFLSLFFFFSRAGSKLHDAFMMGFYTAFYTEQCTSLLLFHDFESH